MCLITEQKEPIILEEDLIVYKQVRLKEGTYESFFFPFKWKSGKLEETKLTSIEEKLIAFDSVVERYYECSTLVMSFKEGFHFAFIKDRLFSAEKWNVKKFLIPAGAQVVKDATGLGVTNKIMML